MAHTNCVCAVPANTTTEMDHLSPVSVDGNTTAGCNSTITCDPSIPVWLITINCLSMGRRAARTTLATRGRFLDIISGYRKVGSYVTQILT